MRCCLCLSKNGSSLLRRDAKSGKRLELLECSECGHIQQKNVAQDEELINYYSHHYRGDYKSVYSPKKKHIFRAGVVALERLALINRYLGGQNRLLDIGAGGGEFVYLANRLGWDARGVEPNFGYSEFARENYEVEVQTGTIEANNSREVDVATMFHVLEHMPDPRMTMQLIHSQLSSGGILFVEVPNILQKDASPHNIFFKAHIQYFNRDTLLFSASEFFECLAIEDNGNLRAIFKKLERLRGPIPPSESALSQNSQLFRNKGWGEYLLEGSGWKKPFSRLKRVLSERAVEDLQPREILDRMIMNQRPSEHRGTP